MKRSNKARTPGDGQAMTPRCVPARSPVPDLPTVDLISRDPTETTDIGRRLGELAQPGDIYLLVGDLGTGKTCLTQGIARGLGIGLPITSPSFTLLNEYTTGECGARLCLYHADLYRLDHADEEALDIGLEDYLYGNGVCVIEWSNKAERLWPPERLVVHLAYLSKTGRRLHLEPRGERYRRLVQELGGHTRGS